MPQILVNKVDSKMHVFSYFDNEWKTDCRRDGENMKIITNKQDDDAILDYSLC